MSAHVTTDDPATWDLRGLFWALMMLHAHFGNDEAAQKMNESLQQEEAELGPFDPVAEFGEEAEGLV